jgi:hypothetical protein
MASKHSQQQTSFIHSSMKELCTRISNQVKSEYRKKSHKCHCMQEWQPVSQGPVVEKSIPGINNMQLLESLRNAKACHQTLLTFLDNFHTVVPGHLAWMNDLSTCCDPDTQKAIKEHIRMYRDIHNTSHSDLETAFEISKQNQVHDANLSYYLAEQVISDKTLTPHDLEVGHVLLRLHKHDPSYTLENFKEDLKDWRSKDLLYPMIVASQYMTTPGDWRVDPADQEFQKTLDTLRTSENYPEVIKAIQAIPYTPLLNCVIEHIGFLYHGKQINTDRIKDSLGHLMTHAVDFLEAPDNIPAFVLVPSVSVTSAIQTATWGVESIPLCMEANSNRLYIRKDKLRAFTKDQLVSTSKKYISTSNQHIFKLGELLLSPTLANYIVHSGTIQQVLGDIAVTNPPPPTKYTRGGFANPVENLQKLRQVHGDSYVASINGCTKILQEQYKDISTSRKLSAPSSVIIPYSKIVAWSINLPKKIISFRDELKDPLHVALDTPHNIARKFHDTKSSLKGVGGVHMVTGDTKSHRKFVCAAIQYKFRDGVNIVKENEGTPHSVLHESVGCFLFHKPTLHNKVELHNSLPWTSEYQDHRYAETQNANNGNGRFRDWCSFASHKQRGLSSAMKRLDISAASDTPEKPQNNSNTSNGFKSKIDAHVLNADPRKTWVSYVPLVMSKEEPVTHKWVCINSSLPFDEANGAGTPLLTLYQQDQQYSGHDMLLLSVKCKLKGSAPGQPVPLLPTRDARHVIDKEDIHIHSDGNTGTVLVVYSSKQDHEKNLDFVAFKLCK